MRVVAPMCPQHSGHWRVRKLFVWIGLLFWIALGVALVALSDRVPKDAMGPIILGTFVCLLVWFLTAGVLMNGAIRASEITDRRIDLVNVHRDFADEWRDAADEIRPSPRRSRDDRERTREQDTP
jgi:hypothetical protein